MKIAVFGCGQIGKKRISALEKMQLNNEHNIEQIYVCDPYVFKDDFSSKLIWFNDISELNPIQPDWIIISTPNDTAIELAKKAIYYNGKILIEKPLGRNYWEALDIFEEAKLDQVYVGFNYRFFSGIENIITDAKSGVFGEVYTINAILGHGGIPGDKNTWRMNPLRAGNGCLLDLGVHIFDILLLLDSKLYPKYGLGQSHFWQQDILDNVSLLCTSDKNNIIANVELSLTKWRNIFKLEIFGEEGYGIVEGRGGFYGTQTYIRGKRWGWEKFESQKESEELIITSDCSNSFYNELDALFGWGDKYMLSPCTITEALDIMKFHDDAYRKVM